MRTDVAALGKKALRWLVEYTTCDACGQTGDENDAPWMPCSHHADMYDSLQEEIKALQAKP